MMFNKGNVKCGRPTPNTVHLNAMESEPIGQDCFIGLQAKPAQVHHISPIGVAPPTSSLHRLHKQQQQRQPCGRNNAFILIEALCIAVCVVK